MKILFIHQNFPGQFKYLAPALAADPANEVVAFTMQTSAHLNWNGVRIIANRLERGSTPGVHPWANDFEAKVIRAEVTLQAALALCATGFVPDVIIAHPGWGESLFLKEVWPVSKLGIYCEFFYQAQGADVGFDREFFVDDIMARCRISSKNANNLMHFEIADSGISPTHWQASTYPDRFRNKITVVHDGIDTVAIAPNPHVALTLNGSLTLTRDDEVITFVNRNLEPYRGYHVFVRALPLLLARRPNARVLIVGGDDTSYGAPAPNGKNWKNLFFDEIKTHLAPRDLMRIHFLGQIPYAYFIALLQLSRVHVYLTYPFVLSWSLLEAMSAGCTIVASDTSPLREAIKHDETGRLVSFFDISGLADEICVLLDDPDTRARLGKNARAFAEKNYDLEKICLPRQKAWIDALCRENG